MKTNSLVSRPSLLPEPTLTAFQITHRNRQVFKKYLPNVTPPDEKTIRRLNELAASRPFCSLHRVKKHEVL
jgi:hypothetical protein